MSRAASYEETLIPHGNSSTSGYMLAVRVPSHPAFGDDDSAPYDCTISVFDEDGQPGTTPVCVFISYLLGVTDITNKVDSYLELDQTGCAGPDPCTMPLDQEVTGSMTFSFRKIMCLSNHTFKIAVSSPDINSAATTKPF
jgi:hypothetical protein